MVKFKLPLYLSGVGWGGWGGFTEILILISVQIGLNLTSQLDLSLAIISNCPSDLSIATKILATIPRPSLITTLFLFRMLYLSKLCLCSAFAWVFLIFWGNILEKHLVGKPVWHTPGTEAYVCSTEVKIWILLFWAGNGFICSE